MNETESNITKKRFTKQQIKLLYRNSAGQYVVYPVSHDRQKRIFDTQSAMLRYYSNDTIFINIISSKIFASVNYNHLVGRKVLLRIIYSSYYKTLNGAIISNSDITTNEKVLILVPNGDIYEMIKSVINKIRNDRGINVLFDLTLADNTYSENAAAISSNMGDCVINNPSDATITKTTRVSEIEQIRNYLIHNYHSGNRLEFKNIEGNEKHPHRYFGI